MFEESKLVLKRLREFIKIEEERNLLMKDLSQALGIDISFTDEEIYNNAMDSMNMELGKTVKKEMVKWMK